MSVQQSTVSDKRIYWVDSTKIIACFFVVIGHFFKSMTASDILPATETYYFFIDSIYCFHVMLFFICSGYLYQKFTAVRTINDKLKLVEKKALALLIPYFSFSLLQWALKMIFSSYVNIEAGNLPYQLFLRPMAPYWYLYSLFLLFCITPIFKSKKSMSLVVLFSVILQILYIYIYYPDHTGIVSPISTVLKNEIWFVLGMVLAFYKEIKPKTIKILGFAFLGSFLALDIVFFKTGAEFFGKDFVLQFLSSVGIILLAQQFLNKETKALKFLSKYTMPVFLMHTIFAAGIRSVLFKLGISSPAIHIVIGIIATFAGPMIAYEIISGIKLLDFFIFPTKYVKIKNKSASKNQSAV